MTFEKAYCKELNGNVTAYKARREYFAQNDINTKFNFFCPDIDCNVELTAVNVYTVGKVKHKPHFRTKKNCEHSDKCSIVNKIDKENKSIKITNQTGNGHGQKRFKYPDEFILQRPKSETVNKSSVNAGDDDFDIEPRQGRKSTISISGESKPHKTSYLENVVDSYEDMSDNELRNSYITLGGLRRTYNATFKQIQYFMDGKNFIFNGDIEPIKVYGKNYSIKFKDKVWMDGKPYPVSIYIKDEIINRYRLSRLFRKSIDMLISLGNDFKTAKCYFVGSYPYLKEIPSPNGKSFMAYEVVIDNLDHLVIKFTE